MKTSTYTLILLALSIHVMVNGQTQDSQTRKMRMDIFAPTRFIETGQNIEGPVSYINKLEQSLKEADELSISTQKLKTELLNIQHQYITKKIEISTLKSVIVYEKFNANRTTIQRLFIDAFEKPVILNKSEILNSEAEYAIKLAKEIRQEANAQPTPEAQLGELSNAEEKEIIALSKQEEVIKLLTQQAPLKSFVLKEEFASAALSENTQVTSENYKIAGTLTELTKQAIGMKSTTEQLRLTAVYKRGYEKQVLLSEASILENEYTDKQIEISLVNSTISCRSFNENRKLIAELLKSATNESMVKQALALNEEAEYNFRIAKEMREEARAQCTKMAKLAEMTNAEEKEIIALNKQQETFVALGKSTQIAYN